MKLEKPGRGFEIVPLDCEIKEVNVGTHEAQIRRLVESVGLSTTDILSADKWLVCEGLEGIVACMALEFRHPLVHIQSLCVDKDNRRKGIARKLVEYGFDKFVKNGEAMTALTLFWNIRTYEKLGFVKVNAKELKRADDVTQREKHKYCTAMLRLKE